MSMIPRSFVPGEVPSTFAPSVSQGENPMVPAGAPTVIPMRNAAPQQLQQTAQAAGQLGDSQVQMGNTIGDRVQNMMDDAATKAAEAKFLNPSLQALSQYQATEGVQAVNQYEPTAAAIAKARQDARAPLTPIQQHMFDQVANQHMLMFGKQMADHENVQRVQYGQNQSKARAGMLNTLSALDVNGRNREDSQFATLGAQSDAEVLNYAGLSGIAPDSPQAQQMLRENRTARDKGVITSLLDQHAYNEASDFFDEHKDEMDMAQSEMIGNAVKAASKAEQVTAYRNQAVQSLQKTVGAGPLTQPVPAATISTTNGVDGVDVHTAPGTNVHAPASGIVSKVWMDDKLGRSVAVTLPSGYTATFNGLSAVNYKEGQKITQGQVLGLSGQDDTGQGVMHYSMTDPNGTYVDPRQAASAPFDPRNFSSPDDEEKAVEWINANVSDPLQQREAEGQVRSLANMNRGILSQQHASALKQATDYSLQNGGSIAGLPAAVKLQLTPEDIDGFNQQVKAKNDVDLLAGWLEKPETQTVDAVKQAYAQGRLSDNGYLSALRGAMQLQGDDTGSTDPQKVRAVSVDHDQLTDILALNQLPSLAQPVSSQDKLQRIELESAIKDEIDVQQQRNNRVLSWQEKGKIARDMVIDKVYTSGMFGTNSGLKPVASLTPDEQSKATVWVGKEPVRMMDIPARQALKATQDLQSHGLPSTQANIAAWWVRNGKPAQ